MSLDKKLLTAYAMGEARGADQERAKGMVDRDPEAKKFVDEVRAFSNAAAADLAQEPLPGERGSAPIKAEIERRAKLKAQAPETRGWWREATISALVLIAVVAVGHKKILRLVGEKSPEVTGEQPPAPVDYETESFFGSHGLQVNPRKLKKLPPDKYADVFTELAELDSRGATEVALGRCRFHIPDASASDTSTEDNNQLFREFKGASGMLIQVMAAAFPREHVNLTQAERVSSDEDSTLVKLNSEEGPAAFYQVSKSANDPVCGIKVLLPQMDFSQADTGEIREAANVFARKLAGNVELKP